MAEVVGNVFLEWLGWESDPQPWPYEDPAPPLSYPASSQSISLLLRFAVLSLYRCSSQIRRANLVSPILPYKAPEEILASSIDAQEDRGQVDIGKVQVPFVPHFVG